MKSAVAMLQEATQWRRVAEACTRAGMTIRATVNHLRADCLEAAARRHCVRDAVKDDPPHLLREARR